GQFTDLTQAGLHAANQAYNLYGQGPQFAGFGDTSQQAHNQIKGLATGNQYLPQANQTVSNVMGGTNPYMQPYTPDVNPFQQGFSDFGANQNTAFNQTVDNAMNRVSDATNSQFGLSGRTGSGLHAGVMTDRLGNVANQMYSDNFAGNQARNLQAMQSGANTYANTQARNLQAQGQGINAWQNQNTQKLAAAGMVPSLNTAKFSDVNQLQMLGATQDRMAQGGLDAEGNNLQNYANIVAQLQGFQVPD
ncbi:MAG: hypothetical protein GY779_18085, partial [Gammaproteobacteria bacterium]|nr:hypothetical protein [Gammaproteobacteria bacterium]